MLWAASTRAQDLELSQERIFEALPAQPMHCLPGSLTAELDPATHAVGSGWAGYNSSTSNPVLNANAEAWIFPRLSLMGGFGTTTQPGDVRLRAQGGLRLMLLSQKQHLLNAAVGFTYRQDRFANEDGMLEWSALVSHRFGATLAVANFVYAQDGEGDDREGELRLIGLHDLGERFHAGIDARARRSLGSTDPHRAEHANPTLEFNAGPLVAYTVDRWSFMAEVGVSGQRVDSLKTGVLAIGGLSAAY